MSAVPAGASHDVPRLVANEASDFIRDCEAMLEAIFLMAAGLNIDRDERDALQLVAQHGLDRAAEAKRRLHDPEA